MKKEINSVFEAYEIGKEYKESGLTDYDFAKSYDIDDNDYVFFMMGYRGIEKPVEATGWRYGKFTEYGHSKNYQSGKMEKGISLMEVFVDGVSMDKASVASEIFRLDTDEKVQVKGYWTPDFWGSDGEPLMLMARRVEV